jgi:hypothetical protein
MSFVSPVGAARIGVDQFSDGEAVYYFLQGYGRGHGVSFLTAAGAGIPGASYGSRD